ncbi:MAG: alpha-L-fucosidase [Niabella sp.]
MKKQHLLALLIFIASQAVFAQHKTYIPDPNPVIQQRVAEWQDLKFGLLMHWGTYSQWGVVESWSICPEDLKFTAGAREKKMPGMSYNDYLNNYQKLQTTFNPVNFNPEKWAVAAKEAGMKYVVFTTKHHDGFCMFDTKTTDYKITDSKTPFASNPRSNVTKEVFDAFRKENFWVGAYFSKPDWHSNDYWWDCFPPIDRNPNYDIKKHPEKWQQFVNYTHHQIDELMSDYGKVDILWLDGGWVKKKTEEEARADFIKYYDQYHFGINGQNQDINMPLLVKNARAKQPSLIVVDRDIEGPYQNYLTPEQHIPEEGLPYPWETCMTMSRSWSYTPDDVYKPTNEIIEKLVDIVSKGGNFLLNVGPKPNGEWSDTVYARMHEIGNWMKTNASAIYNTRAFKVFGEGDNIRFAQSKDAKTSFVYLFNYPEGNIHVKNITVSRKTNMKLLGSSKNLKWVKKDDGIQISLPSALKKVSDYVWVIRVEH